jgi:hypothetical protein
MVLATVAAGSTDTEVSTGKSTNRHIPEHQYLDNALLLVMSVMMMIIYPLADSASPRLITNSAQLHK